MLCDTGFPQNWYARLPATAEQMGIKTDDGGCPLIVISEGRIQESGSHEELLQLNGMYAQLYRTQNIHG